MSLLALTVTVTVLLPEPEFADNVNHVDVPLLTVQLVLDITVNDFCSLEDVKFMDVVDTDKVGLTPD